MGDFAHYRSCNHFKEKIEVAIVIAPGAALVAVLLLGILR